MKINEIKKNYLVEVLHYYRLKKDLEFTEEKIEANQLLEINDKQNALVKFWNKNIENFVRSDELKKHNANKESIEKRITELLNDNIEFDFDEYSSENKIHEYIEEQMSKDESGLLRINLALLTILNNKEFINQEKTKEEISKLLFNNQNRIKGLEKKLEKNYLKICGKTSFDEVGKKVLLGIGLAMAFTFLGSGFIAGASFVEALHGSLIFSAMVVGGSALVYKIIDSDNKDNIIKEFRKLSADDTGAMFALRATLIEESKEIMNKNEFDEFLDSSLKYVSDLRADTEFMLLVEKKDVDETKKKVKIFDNWTSRLTSILVD